MLIKKIILNNFRLFYGKQEINFSTDKSKNVTLILAGNGVGKTTLLNAFLWCFYEKFTKQFENPEDIVSSQAVKEGNNITSVEVLFQHEKSDYLIKRKYDQKNNEKEFTTFFIDNGNFILINNPASFVDSILPNEMSEYFFFDGEYAETFSRINNREYVRKAVEIMLGCNTANQATTDLNAIIKSYDREIAALTKNNKSQIPQDQIDKCEVEINELQNSITTNDSDLGKNIDQQKNINDQLRNFGAAKEIQAKRDGYEMEKKNAKVNKTLNEAKKIRWINDFSMGLLSDKINKICTGIINDENIKGHIPSKIAETFVNDILKNNICICERNFIDGSTEEKAIKSLITEAGNALMSDRLSAIRSRMRIHKKMNEFAVEEFSHINSSLSKLNDEIDDWESKIKECSTLLHESNITEISDREEALMRISAEIIKLNDDNHILSKEFGEKIIVRDNLIVKRNKLLVNNKQVIKIQKKIKLLNDTVILLNTELDEYRDEARKIIIKKVNNILENTTRRDYRADIDESFYLDMYQGNTHESLGRSSGENQLLSLAFIASLVNYAFDRREDNNNLLKPGAMAPFILDSPFGQLDSSYRISTVEFLPKLAEQVVLLVSNTQGDDEVIAALGDRIGSEYVIISEVQHLQDNKPLDIIQLHGKEIVCSLYGCEKDKSTIIKNS